jgi:hypothetical protein
VIRGSYEAKADRRRSDGKFGADILMAVLFSYVPSSFQPRTSVVCAADVDLLSTVSLAIDCRCLLLTFAPVPELRGLTRSGLVGSTESPWTIKLTTASARCSFSIAAQIPSRSNPLIPRKRSYRLLRTRGPDTQRRERRRLLFERKAGTTSRSGVRAVAGLRAHGA